jgi:Spy/CpxP family protein refolding chaperone
MDDKEVHPMKRNLQMLCVALAVSAAAVAQGPGTPPDPAAMIANRVNMLAAQLTLTDAQKASATTIFTNALTASESIRTSLQTNRTSLEAAVQKNDTASIDQLAITFGTLQGQLTAINSKADAAFYAILTATQKTAYDAMPHGGPGGPGGPGGGPMMRGRRGQ